MYVVIFYVIVSCIGVSLGQVDPVQDVPGPIAVNQAEVVKPVKHELDVRNPDPRSNNALVPEVDPRKVIPEERYVPNVQHNAQVSRDKPRVEWVNGNNKDWEANQNQEQRLQEVNNGQVFRDTGQSKIDKHHDTEPAQGIHKHQEGQGQHGQVVDQNEKANDVESEIRKVSNGVQQNQPKIKYDIKIERNDNGLNNGAPGLPNGAYNSNNGANTFSNGDQQIAINDNRYQTKRDHFQDETQHNEQRNDINRISNNDFQKQDIPNGPEDHIRKDYNTMSHGHNTESKRIPIEDQEVNRYAEEHQVQQRDTIGVQHEQPENNIQAHQRDDDNGQPQGNTRRVSTARDHRGEVQLSENQEIVDNDVRTNKKTPTEVDMPSTIDKGRHIPQQQLNGPNSKTSRDLANQLANIYGKKTLPNNMQNLVGNEKQNRYRHGISLKRSQATNSSAALGPLDHPGLQQLNDRIRYYRNRYGKIRAWPTAKVLPEGEGEAAFQGTGAVNQKWGGWRPAHVTAGGRGIGVWPGSAQTGAANDLSRFNEMYAKTLHRGTIKQEGSPIAPKRPSQTRRRNITWNYMQDRSFIHYSQGSNVQVKQAPVPKRGSPWPMPQYLFQRKKEYLVFEFNLEVIVSNLNDEGKLSTVVQYNLKRLWKNAFGKDYDPKRTRVGYQTSRPCSANADTICSLLVTVDSKEEKYPSLESKENYTLFVQNANIEIHANEVWGAVRALETLGQLLMVDYGGKVTIRETRIRDFPRFRHRGMLVDTSRHFITKETLITNLEAMAQNKLNVFHWHITDDQSFPFQSIVLPELSNFGAYNPRTHIYTHSDIKEIIEEARLRGIRVIPEFDSPGHTYAWGYGIDNLLTPCHYYSGYADGTFGPLNPLSNTTYQVLEKLFQEVSELFPDHYMHLGEDEVETFCWRNNPDLKTYMHQHGLWDVNDLWKIYHSRLKAILKKISKTRRHGDIKIITWQEAYDFLIDNSSDTVVEIWKDGIYKLDDVTGRQNKKAIFASCWYLDHVYGHPEWPAYYNCHHSGSSFSRHVFQNESNILGGEACLWTEQIDDASVINKAWPRASAVAERLWSSHQMTSIDEAGPRIEEQRCRMLRRGLPVDVLSGPGHCEPDEHLMQSLLHQLPNKANQKLLNHYQDIVEFSPGSITSSPTAKMDILITVIIIIIVILLIIGFLHGGRQHLSKHFSHHQSQRSLCGNGGLYSFFKRRRTVFFISLISFVSIWWLGLFIHLWQKGGSNVHETVITEKGFHYNPP